MIKMKTILELAKHYVDQWENYDIHKATDVDKVLYNNGVEPDIVALSYEVFYPKIGSIVNGGGIVVGIMDPVFYRAIQRIEKERLDLAWGEDHIYYDVYYVAFKEPVRILTFEEFKNSNPELKEEFLEQEYNKVPLKNILAIPGNKIQWEGESQEQESSIKEEESSVKE